MSHFETLFERFPILAEKIFCYLSWREIEKSRLVCQRWKNFLGTERLENLLDCRVFHESWLERGTLAYYGFCMDFSPYVEWIIFERNKIVGVRKTHTKRLKRMANLEVVDFFDNGNSVRNIELCLDDRGHATVETLKSLGDGRIFVAVRGELVNVRGTRRSAWIIQGESKLQYKVTRNNLINF